MKRKGLFFILIPIWIVAAVFAIVMLVSRISNRFAIQAYVEPYKEVALSYVIDTLESQGALNPNITYDIDKSVYHKDDNADKNDEFPYVKLEFYIEGADTYVVTMEKNEAGEFEITDFTILE